MDCSVSSDSVDTLEALDIFTGPLPFREPAERFLPRLLAGYSSFGVGASKLPRALFCRSVFCGSVVLPLPDELDAASLSFSVVIKCQIQGITFIFCGNKIPDSRHQLN